MGLPGIAEIRHAAEMLRGRALETPLLESDRLNRLIGRRLFLKPECLQLTGSFKFRGAYYRLSQLSAAERKAGVVAFSSGNHAQGVAAAARLLGMPALIVMPSDAPGIKIAGTRAFGAEVRFYDRYTESREAIAAAIAADRGAVLVPAYDDPFIIAGQGSMGIELVAQMPHAPARVYCPAGGGGLIAGLSTALKHAWPQTQIFACEPQGFDDWGRSLAAGRRLKNGPGASTICDALMAPEPGDLTFAINRQTLAGGVALPDDLTRRAMRVAFDHFKLVLEPGGAVGLAAALLPWLTGDGAGAGPGDIAVICSGGNVDAHTFATALAVSGLEEAGGGNSPSQG